MESQHNFAYNNNKMVKVLLISFTHLVSKVYPKFILKPFIF